MEDAFYHAVADRLPIQRTINSKDQIVFISSIRYFNNSFVCRFNCVFEDEAVESIPWTCVITGLVFPAFVDNQDVSPDVLLDLLKEVCGSVNENDVIDDTIVFYDADNKRYRECYIILFRSSMKQQRFYRALIDKNIDALGFSRWSIIDGNCPALINRLKIACFLLPKTLTKTQLTRVHLTNLAYDENIDREYMMMLHNHIYRVPFVEAAFDIETLVDGSRTKDFVKSPLWLRHKLLSQRAAELRPKLKTYRLLPQISVNPLDHGEITSIALVLRTGRPKRKIIFYNAGLAHTKPKKHESSFFITDTNIEFISCNDERIMLEKFLNALQPVNVLYVYNAEFDIQVIDWRISFWRCRGYTDVMVLWQKFLQKDSDVPYMLYFSSDDQLNEYKIMLDTCEAAIAQQKTSSIKKIVDEAINRFMVRRDKCQSFRAVGFATHIVDLYRVINTHDIITKCPNRRLDTIARHVIGTNKPQKHILKTCKVADVHYLEMDDWFCGDDGEKLYTYLIYNLTDAQLLLRLARILKPVDGILNRLRATLNIDVLHYGRTKFNFDGYVQSTRAVEMPLMATRLKYNILVCLNSGAAERLLPVEFKDGTNIPFIGGYVAEPKTGLLFAGPGQSVEATLDFSSLYPSNMIDMNISSDAVIGKEFVTNYPGWVVFDWSLVEKDFNCVSLMNEPCGKKLVTMMSGSLNNYLTLRNQYKKHMTKVPFGDRRYKYYDRQQQEMKICANSHYGVSPFICQVLITALGRHRIKLVEKLLYENGFFPNYGDTDSTMFNLKIDASGEYVNENSFECEVGEDEWLDDVEMYLKTQLSVQQLPQVKAFLELVDIKLVDDAVAKMFLVCPNTRRLIPVLETSFCQSIRQTFIKHSITKLCFENFASVVMRLQKKMYITLSHEATKDNPLAKTDVKIRGIIAKRTSAVGATKTISAAFIDLVVKGFVLCIIDDFDRYAAVSWKDVKVGDRVWLGEELEIKSKSIFNGKHRSCISVIFSNGVKKRILLDFKTGISLNHLISWKDHEERCLSFEHFCVFVGFSTAAAFNNDWSALIEYVTVARQNPHLRIRRLAFGLEDLKEGRVPFVKLVMPYNDVYRKNEVMKYSGCDKQDPAAAFCHRYYFDVGLDVLRRDTIGRGLKCTDSVGNSLNAISCHRNVIKHIIHELLLGNDTKTKLLGHVIIERVCFKTPAVVLANSDLVMDVLNGARLAFSALVKKLNGTIEYGSLIHKKYFNKIPPDMALQSLPTIKSFFKVINKKTIELPDQFYDMSFNGAAVAEKLLDAAISEALVANIIKRVQRQPTAASKGIFLTTVDGVYEIITRNTANPIIARCARSAYLMDLFVEKKKYPLRRSIEMVYDDIEHVLGPPPKRAKRDQLKRWFVDRRPQLETLTKLHCAACSLFWRSVDISNILNTEYTQDQDGYFVRNRKIVCLDQAI